MKETFLYAFRAIAPILLLILLGYVMKQIASWDGDFYRQLNRLCFRLFLPVQLFCSVYTIENLSELNWRLVGFQFSGILACALVGLLAASLLVPDRRQKGVMVQASFRSNQAILGLPLAQGLGGEAAMAYASLATSVCVPLFNFLAVLTLTYYGDGEKRPPLKALLKRVFSNPLIIGALLGLLLAGLRQAAPAMDLRRLPSLYQALQNLSKVASPVMLFVLGTCLDFKAVRRLLPQLSLGVGLRLIVAPVLVLGTGILLREPLGLTAVEMPTMITVCASPVAVSSAVMVQELGGDEQLANQLVVWSSVLSMASVFCIVYVLRMWGLL